ncbi:Oidioi.mRNA.OKI2018_I69.chr1.g172.t1.cds [Oikopleura dioica]|uniref:Oidioi.mRNA.OKI2018_I69.chr1.g172.t1.cds n=1 Tax=Oikopleura dioica TaxID=34765 RepID=A0ABN7SQB2_OIKDI|nr:Oidioi.mRNA.OKI2018_I69.chr1.g172.t1.cds [Oikopleura dioica]
MNLLKKISKLIGVEEKSKNAEQKREKSNENDEDYQNLIQANRLSRKSNSSCPSPSVCMRKTPSVLRKQLSDSSEKNLPRASTISDFTPRTERRSLPTTPGLKRNLTATSLRSTHI